MSYILKYFDKFFNLINISINYFILYIKIIYNESNIINIIKIVQTCFNSMKNNNYIILFEIDCIKYKSIIKDILFKLYSSITDIKNKIAVNSYIILSNNEYLVQENIIADIVYTIIKNYKLIYESFDIYIFYKSRAIKIQFIAILKFLISILENYIKEKEKKPSIFTVHPLFKILRKFIKFLLYCGKVWTFIGILVCIFQKIIKNYRI
ncbi:putative integral membrane protein (apicoplast) [Theileria parva strain Muguga]|uniref:Uncharacterized protein n=1 Tax=Theileria parva TaxID=5875 RepID=Q4MYB4_THEPA|nr:putative integral membrane protein [Theileria parva strain Muguga]|eukprot:XP_762678.1 hypothetical protein (apicoplast) [Theileria parva strain Muguga]